MRPPQPARHSPAPLRGYRIALAFAVGTSCDGPPAERVPIERAEVPEFTAAQPVLRRLTTTQYANSLVDIFGERLVLPSSLEPDEELEGLFALGAAVSTISARGIEQYEDAAFSLAEQIISDEALYTTWVPCIPSGPSDEACASETFDQLLRSVWRRPPTSDELDSLTAITIAAAETYDDFDAGLVYGFAGALQSPYFLYRVETGEDDPDAPGQRRYSDWEMASRLAAMRV